MKTCFGFIQEIKETTTTIRPDALIFDSDWFLNTTPSIKDTHLFLPDWENPGDTDWVMMYFLAECYNDLLKNNDHVLCAEARAALVKYAEYRR